MSGNDRPQTLRAWAVAAWRQVMSRPERPTGVLAPQRDQSRVSAQFVPLYDYLERRYASMVVLTFDQIERLLGCPLPVPARSEHAWWVGDRQRPDGYADAWTMARRTATPNFSARTVAFERCE